MKVNILDQNNKVIAYSDYDNYKSCIENMTEANFVGVKALFEDIQSAGLEIIKSLHASVLRRKMGNRSTEELLTLERQVRAAEAMEAGNPRPAQTIMLENLKVGDESLNDIAARILAKADAGDMLIGIAGGKKRDGEKAIEAAVTTEEVEMIVTGATAVIEQAESDYDAMIAQLMA